MRDYIVINGVKYAPVEKGQIIICDKDCDLYNNCSIKSLEFDPDSFCYVELFDVKSMFKTMKEIE